MRKKKNQIENRKRGYHEADDEQRKEESRELVGQSKRRKHGMENREEGEGEQVWKPLAIKMRAFSASPSSPHE